MQHAAEEEPQYEIGSDSRRFEYLPVSALVVDPNKQRVIRSNSRVTMMSKAWSWVKAEAATVAPRDHGHYDVIEGQHRIVALKLAVDDGIVSPDVTFPCFIVEGLAAAEQAQLGVEIPRSRSSHTALDKWNQDLRAGKPRQIRVEQVLSDHGLSFSMTASSIALTCVGTVERLVSRFDATTGADHFDDALSVLETAYPSGTISAVARWNRHLLEVVFGLVVGNVEHLDPDRLAMKLSLMPAESWVELGRGPRGGGVPAIREELVKRYNQHLRNRRIS